MDKRFQKLRYGQCWEDADILLEGLKIDKDDLCVSIASAGCNSLSLLAKNPKKVIAIDLNPTQIYALELRIAAFKSLDHNELLELFGLKPSNNRLTLYEKCSHALLSQDARNFWDSHKKAIASYSASGCGRFEKYLRFMFLSLRFLAHSKSIYSNIFRQNSLDEQLAFFNNSWNTVIYRNIARMLGSEYVVGLLGRHPSFFKFTQGKLPDLLLKRFEHVLTQSLAKDNPYLQCLLLQKNRLRLPHYLRPENFELIRNNLHKLEYYNQGITQFIENNSLKINKWNMSNIFEYIDHKTYKEWLSKIANATAISGKIMYWNLLTPRILEPDDPFFARSDEAEKLFQKDHVPFYSRIVIGEKLTEHI